jgi:hypothetical protein
MSKLCKLQKLSPMERHLLVRALLLVTTVRLGLWLLPFSTQRRILARLDQAHPRLPRVAVSPDQIARAVVVAGRYVPRATCLTQALAAQVLLKGAGFLPLLRIGVARDTQGRFQAHAWVENSGKVLIGGCDLASYTPFRALSGFSVPVEGDLSSTFGKSFFESQSR